MINNKYSYKDLTLNVQVRAVPNIEFENEEIYDYTLEYRVEPSQLSWFKRTFLNEWRPVYACLYDCLSEKKISTFDIERDFPRYKQLLRTLEDINTYEKKEYNKAMEKRLAIQDELNKKNKIYY